MSNVRLCEYVTILGLYEVFRMNRIYKLIKWIHILFN